MAANGWNSFWFSPGDPARLGKIRALFYGAFFLFYLPWDFTLWGQLPEVFWMPTPFFRFLGIPVFSPALLALLQWVWKGALLSACLGFFTRTSMAVSCVLGAYLLGLPHNFGKTHHYDAMVVLILGVLAFSRAGDAFSLDRRGRPKPAPSGEYTWPVQAARVIICSVFFGAGIAKLRASGLGWGSAAGQMKFLLVQGQYNTFGAPPVTDWGVALAGIPWFGTVMGIGTLILETGYPLALFFPRTRWFFIPGIIGMLVGIRLLMGPTFYPFILCQLFWLPL